jgi:hypothetical protein
LDVGIKSKTEAFCGFIKAKVNQEGDFSFAKMRS